MIPDCRSFFLSITIVALIFVLGCSTSNRPVDPVSSADLSEEESSEDSAPQSDSVDEEKILEPSEPVDMVHVPGDEEAGEDLEDEGTSQKSSPPVRALSEDKVVLKNRILEVELETLGDTKKKTLGIHGDLKACRVKLASKAYGGPGTLFWDEPDDRISESWLSDGDRDAKAFQAALMIVELRKSYLKSELESCEKSLGSLTKKPGESLSATLTEGDADNDDRVNRFICGFVKKGASLKEFLLQSFSKRILKIEHFDLSQEFLISNVSDSKGRAKDHGLMFMGWKLAFDKGPLALDQILFGKKDAALINWLFPEKDKVSNHQLCLKKSDGEWNP